MAIFTVHSAPAGTAADSGSFRTAEDLLRADRPVVIAHRGYSKFAPENTLRAFEMAKMAGADLVELDYHHTRDGIPVVIHDPELDRTTDAVTVWGCNRIRVDSKARDELAGLDAGLWFKPALGGASIPSLEEALKAIEEGGMALIERKAGDAATCVNLLRQHGLINRVVVQSFDWNYLSDFHRQEPGQVLGALGPPGWYGGKELSEAEKTLNNKWVDAAAEAGARIVVWNRQITRESVAYAHDCGLKVWVYTIDESPLAADLLDLGADGLISNNISLLWRTIALRQQDQRILPSPAAASASAADKTLGGSP